MTMFNQEKDLTHRPAFESFPYDSQKVFRLLLNAQAYPARVINFDFQSLFLAPPPMDPAAAAILLTLCDYDTGIFLSPSLKDAGSYLTFHTGAKTASQGDAVFALYRNPGELSSLSDLSKGTESYPDHSATIILAGALSEEGPDLIASGPGIKEPKPFKGRGLSKAFVEERALALMDYPLGVDIFLTCPDSSCALPRTTMLEFK
jgi:alpha-D-ribose 1-methylphosphonate 5-triphosphate synthase subunit PhnH